MTKDSSQIEWPLVFPGWQGYIDIIAEATICCFAMNLHTISNQFENPALVQLLSYVCIAYSFGFDKVLFGTDFATLQMIGLAVILSFNVCVILYRLFK